MNNSAGIAAAVILKAYTICALDQYLGAANVINIDKERVAAVRKLEKLLARSEVSSARPTSIRAELHRANDDAHQRSPIPFPAPQMGFFPLGFFAYFAKLRIGVL